MSIETEIAALAAASSNLTQTIIDTTAELSSNTVGEGASLIGLQGGGDCSAIY